MTTDFGRFWRQNAEVARQLATSAYFPEERDTLLDIATDYMRAATRADAQETRAVTEGGNGLNAHLSSWK